MSIYATLWELQFPPTWDDQYEDVWVTVRAQSVPAHIGTPTPGYGYEEEDPYKDFLPPPVHSGSPYSRAVVIIKADSKKGTPKHPQEYPDPLLILSGLEYATMQFGELYDLICAALWHKRD